MAQPSVPELVPNTSVKDPEYDSVVVVTDSLDKLVGDLECLKKPLEEYSKVDSIKDVVLVNTDVIPSKRLIWSPTGPLNRDQDDVRRFYDAGEKGLKRALKAGSKKPLLVRPIDQTFPNAGRCATLGALHAAYVPIEIRESIKERATKVEKIGVWCDDLQRVTDGVKIVNALEFGRVVARDIGGSDPERMAAPRVAEYLEGVFKDTCIKMTVISDIDQLTKEYPLLSAVNRAARFVERHQARLIFLEYTGEGEIEKTLFMVGKGITYDTGGADVKAGGVMAGMHRDKCGAAAVAGFFKTLSILKPKGIKVVGGLAMVRNSIGSECYVADEIITSRAGVRVRVGNTDAEGRMVMADVLCRCKEMGKLMEALHLLGIKPHLGSVEDVTKLLKAFGKIEDEPKLTVKTEPTPIHGSFHYPKLSSFFGEDGKGDVNWAAFKYEIEALVTEGSFSDNQILLGLRRACRGKAADKLRRLGTDVKVKDILEKFDSEYGSVESRETVMKRFYSCKQLENETVSAYATRLEDIFDQGIQLKTLNRSDIKILKEVFHAGLRKDLRLMSMYQADKIDNYDELKREVRRIEASLSEPDSPERKTKTCKVAVATEKPSQEMAEVKELLQRLNERIDRLEKDKDMDNSHYTGRQQGFQQRGRGYRGGNRGFSGNTVGGGRGRGNYHPQRPIGGQQFQPTCWTCNQKGHVQRDCPSSNRTVCYNCNEQGHKQKFCPKA